MPAEDKFKFHVPGLNSPSSEYFAITKGDTSASDFPTVSRAIRVGTGGDVVAVRTDGSTVLFRNCYPGEMLPVRAVRVMTTGTTAADLVALC
ncbi:hypothetical protein D8I24_6536 [Cupriavidus necator H850]|uniref:spike base protein, RCAP_Rcc01079 family n=1 Tax=Cupriavidus necator TaxID=106590 RepID=UPI00129DE0C1|nr:hypothetical protein [Cupriavidus necator]KAI3597720.1 hypothetical protein D8I24_6536 [Cupriavidus necator H850]